jgi:hypothetical protein
MNNSNREFKKVSIPKHLEWYLEQGFSIIPLEQQSDTKKPLVEWTEYQERKPTTAEIADWYKQTKRFAIVCGEVSGNLVIIDVDEEELFGSLNLGVVAAKTYTEERQRKFHIFLRTTKPIKHKTLPFDDKEEISIRFNGDLIIAGGTAHPSGGAYRHFSTSPKEIATVDVGFFDDLEKLWNDYHGLSTKKSFANVGLKKGISLKSSILEVIKGCTELKELKDNGDTYTCRCPFPKHRDLTPSFVIYKKSDSYYCFGCNRGGNAVTFVKDFLGVPKKEAIARLKDRHLIEIEKEEEKEEFKRKAHFEKDGRLYLEILTFDEQYKFAYLNNGKVELVDIVDDVLPIELPHTHEGELAFIVKLPDEDIASCDVLDAAKLLDRIKTHIRKYCDMPDMDAELCAYYTLFTWLYKKTNTVGYLRFIADTGKGKSRMVTVVSDICFYPTSTGGSSSFSGLMRTNERWHGTLIMDEADMAGGKESQVIKYLNAGFEAGKYFMLSDKNDPKRQEVFDPFTPKIIGMREHFRDMATEGRLLSISPHERTNEDIPIILRKEYYEEARQLRNTIARFVLARWHDVNGEEMLEFKRMGIEPRLQQLAMPLSIIFQLWNGGKETFKEYIASRQKELKKTRAQSWHGSIFNLVYAIAIGDVELTDEYALYYNPDGEIEAITPSMIAKAMNTAAKTATETLSSIGFDVELRYITQHIQIDKDEWKEKRKRVRTYVVPDGRTWKEIIQRYYYDGFDEEVSDRTDGTDTLTNSTNLEIPTVLKSKKYERVPCTVPSVPSVPQSEGDSENGTDGTDGTLYSTHKEKILDERCDIKGNVNFQAKQNIEAQKRLEGDGNYDTNFDAYTSVERLDKSTYAKCHACGFERTCDFKAKKGSEEVYLCYDHGIQIKKDLETNGGVEDKPTTEKKHHCVCGASFIRIVDLHNHQKDCDIFQATQAKEMAKGGDVR